MPGILLIDPFSGISGNMFIGAFLNIGLPFQHLREELEKLGIEGYELTCRIEERRGISGTYFNVVDLGHDSHHAHEHGAGHHHDHRTYRDIKEIIGKSRLSTQVKTNALAIFRLIAEAEAKIHNKPVEEISFHEVGAIDSIIDICGAAIAVEFFSPEGIHSKPVNIGSGFVECAHGTFPVPAPATIEILKGVPTFVHGDFETTTPTGAAILKHYVSEFSQPRMRIEESGYGVGSKNPGRMPNVLRVTLGTLQSEIEDKGSLIDENLLMLETNIDDMNPQLYSHLMDLCFQKGALDVYLTNVLMKKNRPGTLFSVLCRHKSKKEILKTLFGHSSTLGVRETAIVRHSLHREVHKVTTPFGVVRIKTATLSEGEIKVHPEYDDCLKIAQEQDIPVKVVMEEALKNFMPQ